MARGLVVIQFLGGSNPLGHPMQRAHRSFINSSTLLSPTNPMGDRAGAQWSNPFRCIFTH